METETEKKMMENDEDCSDVLVQISAVSSALNGLGKAIIKEHMTHCITHAIEDAILPQSKNSRMPLRVICIFPRRIRFQGKIISPREACSPMNALI